MDVTNNQAQVRDIGNNNLDREIGTNNQESMETEDSLIGTRSVVRGTALDHELVDVVRANVEVTDFASDDDDEFVDAVETLSMEPHRSALKCEEAIEESRMKEKKRLERKRKQDRMLDRFEDRLISFNELRVDYFEHDVGSCVQSFEYPPLGMKQKRFKRTIECIDPATQDPGNHPDFSIEEFDSTRAAANGGRKMPATMMLVESEDREKVFRRMNLPLSQMEKTLTDLRRGAKPIRGCRCESCDEDCECRIAEIPCNPRFCTCGQQESCADCWDADPTNCHLQHKIHCGQWRLPIVRNQYEKRQEHRRAMIQHVNAQPHGFSVDGPVYTTDVVPYCDLDLEFDRTPPPRDRSVVLDSMQEYHDYNAVMNAYGVSNTTITSSSITLEELSHDLNAPSSSLFASPFDPTPVESPSFFFASPQILDSPTSSVPLETAPKQGIVLTDAVGLDLGVVEERTANVSSPRQEEVMTTTITQEEEEEEIEDDRQEFEGSNMDITQLSDSSMATYVDDFVPTVIHILHDLAYQDSLIEDSRVDMTICSSNDSVIPSSDHFDGSTFELFATTSRPILQASPQDSCVFRFNEVRLDDSMDVDSDDDDKASICTVELFQSPARPIPLHDYMDSELVEEQSGSNMIIDDEVEDPVSTDAIHHSPTESLSTVQEAVIDNVYEVDPPVIDYEYDVAPEEDVEDAPYPHIANDYPFDPYNLSDGSTPTTSADDIEVEQEVDEELMVEAARMSDDDNVSIDDVVLNYPPPITAVALYMPLIIPIHPLPPIVPPTPAPVVVPAAPIVFLRRSGRNTRQPDRFVAGLPTPRSTQPAQQIPPNPAGPIRHNRRRRNAIPAAQFVVTYPPTRQQPRPTPIFLQNRGQLVVPPPPTNVARNITTPQEVLDVVTDALDSVAQQDHGANGLDYVLRLKSIRSSARRMLITGNTSKLQNIADRLNEIANQIGM